MDSLMKLLTKEDLRKIDNYRIRFGCNDATPTASIETILKPWADNKNNFLSQIFTDNLIISKKVQYERPYQELFDAFDKACNIDSRNPIYQFRVLFTKALEAVYTDRIEILGENYFLPPYFYILELLDTNVLAKNKAGFEATFICGDKKIQIQKESKPVKILSKVVSALNFDIEIFEKFRIAHSVILNDKYIKGELCLSIHPMDYMTMSDSGYDWSSCMSWMRDGEYHRGTVEMMTSPSVVVVYLKGSREYIEDIKWNTKKWRCLYIVTPEFITSIKAYPYENSDLEKLGLNFLVETIEEKTSICYRKDYCRYNYYDNDLPCDHNYMLTLFDNNKIEVEFDFSTDDMYNDFGARAGCWATINSTINEERFISYNYSGPTVCMSCGAINACYDDENSPCLLTCNDCYVDNRIYCECCGERIYDGDESYSTLDMVGPICENCYYEDCAVDVITEDRAHINNSYLVYLKSDEDIIEEFYVYHLEKKSYIRAWEQQRWDNIFIVDSLKPYIEKNPDPWNKPAIEITKEQLTEEGYKILKEYFE